MSEEFKGLEEKTVVLVKPDGVARGLTGEIIARIEKAGLKIIALKMVKPEPDFIDGHYPKDKEYITNLGNKTLKTYKKYKMDPEKELGTSDPFEIGQKVREWLLNSISSGPVVAMAIAGNHAIDGVRNIVGPTMPYDAPPGTIRGDFSNDSPALANRQKRAIKNLVHASGTPEEAENELKHWFAANDFHKYGRADEKAMFA